MEQLAPIALFVYSRPVHTRKVLESLMANTLSSQSTLYIFADGPNPKASPQTLENIKQVRQLIKEKSWCGKVILRESEVNRGIASSIINGVTELVNQHGKVIVLEDDLVLHPDFLQFMNDSLIRYEGEKKVYAITGHQFPLKFSKSMPDAFFVDEITSWTWATWKRAWDDFDPKATGWERLKSDKAFRKKFNLGNAIDYAGMLEKQMTGEIDSWAIRWYWTLVKKQGVSLFPKYSLVKNLGLDGSGTHCYEGQQSEDILYEGHFRPKYPDQVIVNKKAKSMIADFLRMSNSHDIITRVRRKLIKLFGTK